MDITPFLKSLEVSGVAVGIRNSLILFPLLEATHVIALALVFGTIVIIDIRVLGVASARRPFALMSKDILKWTWAGFALSVVTGSLMFTTNAQVYAHNPFFRAKLVLLAFAGLNMLVFQLTAGRTVHHWGEAPTAPRIAKATAALSLVLWVSIIFMGRVIGFTTTGAAAKQEPPPTANVDFDSFLQSTPSNSAAPSPPPPPK